MAIPFMPDTRTDLERLRDRWDDTGEAGRLTRAGFNREGMLAAAEAHELRKGLIQ